MNGAVAHDALTITLQHRSEPALRAAIAQTLRAHGIAVDEQVVCAAGAADLVTTKGDVILEAKLFLNRRSLQQATGQLLLYRASINPTARMIVVGYPTQETAALRPHIEALGIEVVCWKDEVGRMTEETPATSPSPLILYTSSLRWRLAEHAQSRGIATVRTLSFVLRGNRQSLYPIWGGTAKSISVAMLARLCATLDADPGGWFHREGGTLMWTIRAAAEAQGMDMPTLGWESAILPGSLTPIWRGVQQFVFVETLAKIARALDLQVGDLFEWQELRTEDERGLRPED
jgi:DNA-binding Xre family transcriptional regulator